MRLRGYGIAWAIKEGSVLKRKVKLMRIAKEGVSASFAIIVAANAWARGPAANGAAGGFVIAKGGRAKAVISVESPRHPSATFAAASYM